MEHLLNIFHLGVKELYSLGRDRLMLIIIGFAFSGQIYVIATGLPQSLHKAPIAIVDEDQSPLSARIADAFYPPHFKTPDLIAPPAADSGMDTGLYSFVLDIPPDFQRDLLAGRRPAIQLNVDATRISQAFTGSHYVQTIVQGEVAAFVHGQGTPPALPVALASRILFNPNLDSVWFGSVMEWLNSITALSVILTGAALIREREHGTVEHLLAMPLAPWEIMLAKVWSMGLVVAVVALLSLLLVVHGLLGVPLHGSLALFCASMALYLFTTTSLGILLGTVARSMPQFGLLLLVIVLPLQMLSGGLTPRESMPQLVQDLMLAAPSTHFVALAQAILYRGADLAIVWPKLLALLGIGAVFFVVALRRFRNTVNAMG